MGFFDKQPDTVGDDGTISPGTYNASRALVASATKIDLRDKKDEERMKKRLDSAKWQRESWDYYDFIGEISFSANLVANILSRINLYVAYNEDSRRIPTPVKDVESIAEYADISEAILHLLESGDGGSSGLLRDAALNMFIAGEYYLVREPAQFLKGIPEKWQIRSVDEIVVEAKGRNKGTYLKSARTESREDWISLPDNSFISRMWRRHPRYSAEADSSMRSILDDCDDLLLFSREARAISSSRIPAGILYLPDGLDNSAVSDGDGDFESDGSDDNQQSIIEEMLEAFNGPINDENHANTQIPLIFRGPADLGEKIRLIQLAKTIDPMFDKMVNMKLDRILASLDIPKDVAKGLSNVKYSNGIVIEESLYKSHIEPLTLLIVDSLTNGFLRPALRAQGIPEETISRMVIWYDPSAITAKPSKAEAANFGVENNVVSGKAWRAANGFSESDAPSEDDKAQKLVTEKLILNEQMSEKLLTRLMPETMESIRNEMLATSNPGSANDLNQALGIDPATGAPTEEGVIIDGEQAPSEGNAPPLIEP